MDSFFKQAYVEGFFPTDERILANRGIWSKFFDDKKNITDSKWVTIDDWTNASEDSNHLSSDEIDNESVELQVFDSSDDVDNEKQLATNNINQNCMQIQRYDKLQFQKELTETIKLIDFYFKDIVNKRLKKWEELGLCRLLPPATTENMNTWFDKFDSFKGKVKIKETRTISFTRDSDTADSSDTAKSKRGGRNKVKKLIADINTKRLIKQYSYEEKIEANKKFEVKRNKKYSKENLIVDDRRSPRYYNTKINQKRLRKYPKFRKSSSHSSSSSEKVYRNCISRSTCLLNRTHISSDETDNSDPDDRILENVRKTYKDFVNTAVINSSEQLSVQRYPYTPCALTQPTEPIVEFPNESGEKLVVYNSNQCAANDIIEVLDTNEDDSEEDNLFMSNKKRLQLYGKCIVEQPISKQSLVLYRPDSKGQIDLSNESSTDDGLFKLKNYKPL